jgi:hypothetical protein
MQHVLFIILALFSAAAVSGMPEPLGADAPVLIVMGPDPGGHTGAGVTPDTTKTDRPEVDAARKAASGSKTENNSPTNSTQSKASGKPAN